MATRLGSEKVLIEAFGLPGSGKTALIERMLAEPEWSERQVLRYKDVMLPLRGVFGRKAVLGSEFMFFRLRKNCLWSAAQAVADSLDYAPRLVHRHKVRLLKECFFIKRALTRKAASEVIVLDQGPIQAVWQLLCYSGHVNRDALDHLLWRLEPWVAKCSLLITTSEGQAINRVKQRGSSDCPFDQMDSAAVSLAFRNHAVFFEETVPTWLAGGGHVAVDCSEALREPQSFAEAHHKILKVLAQPCEQRCLVNLNEG